MADRALITPTYEQYIEAFDLDDWQTRVRLIQERDELRAQRDAAIDLCRIIVRHESS